MTDLHSQAIRTHKGRLTTLVLLFFIALLVISSPWNRSAFLSNIGGIWLAKWLIATDTAGGPFWRMVGESEPALILDTRAAKIDDWLTIALAANSGNQTALRFVGLMYMAKHEWPAAQRVLYVAIEREPSHLIARYWLAHAYAAQGRFGGAVQLWAGLGAGKHLAGIAEGLVTQQRLDESLHWYELAIRVAESSSHKASSDEALGWAYRGLGEIYRTRGQLLEAISYYESAVSYLPNRTDYRYVLARMHEKVGRFDDAEKQLKVSIEMEPHATAWPGALGEVYLQASQLDQAEGALLQCLQTGEDKYWRARAYYALSIIYNQRRQWERSVETATNAMRLLGVDPSWVAQLRYNFGEALRANPERLDWYLMIGDAYFAAGSIQEARSYYEVAASRWPRDPQVKERLRRIAALGRDDANNQP